MEWRKNEFAIPGEPGECAINIGDDVMINDTLNENDLKDIIKTIFEIDENYIVPIKERDVFPFLEEKANNSLLETSEKNMNETFIGYRIFSKKKIAGLEKISFRVSFIGKQAEEFANHTLTWKTDSQIREVFKAYNVVFRNSDSSEINTSSKNEKCTVWYADFTVEKNHDESDISPQEKQIALYIDEYLDNFFVDEVILTDREVHNWPVVLKILSESVSTNTELRVKKMSGFVAFPNIRNAMKSVKKCKFVQMDDDDSKDFRILYKSKKTLAEIINEK